MELTSKLGKVQWMCDECGAIYDDRIGCKWDDTEWHKPTREYAFGEEDA